MKQCALLLVTVMVLVNSIEALSEDKLEELWTQFKVTHKKQYNDNIEDAYRRAVFARNVDYIAQHNIEADLGKHSFTLGVNEYSDWTRDEYRKFLLGAKVPADIDANATDHVMDFASVDVGDLPDSVDWRTKGYVTPVKNQGACGSCWAFSSTGGLEGQWFRKSGKLISLSEQNLVDCSQPYGNYGCGGGWMFNAFRYVKANGGIDTEDSYPYEAVNGQCRFKSSAVGATCTGYGQVSPAGNEAALMAVVATYGPVTVAIDASQPSFGAYKGGIYNEPRCTQGVDHAVLVVGYGTEGGAPYWIVKNSWGTSWGEAGYIRMSRNKNNQCAIASYAFLPTV